MHYFNRCVKSLNFTKKKEKNFNARTFLYNLHKFKQKNLIKNFILW